MKLQTQPDGYSCGIYSIINALSVYDEELSRLKVGALTDTTKKNGTNERGIQKALCELGYKYRVYKTENPNLAWRWVLRHSINHPLILYVDHDHWLAVAGRVRNKVILLDSYDTAHVVGKKELLERWQDKNYWGMIILKNQ